jgi:hypothetical protein
MVSPKNCSRALNASVRLLRPVEMPTCVNSSLNSKVGAGDRSSPAPARSDIHRPIGVIERQCRIPASAVTRARLVSVHATFGWSLLMLRRIQAALLQTTRTFEASFDGEHLSQGVKALRNIWMIRLDTGPHGDGPPIEAFRFGKSP